MVRSLASNIQTQLDSGRAVWRDAVWFTVRDRSDGSAYSEGYWSGDVPVTFSVRVVKTGSLTSRAWLPAPGLIRIPPIPLRTDLTAQRVPITLNGASSHVQDLLRTYDPRGGEVEIYSIVQDIKTRAVLTEGFSRFLGRIDQVRIPTAAAGGAADVVVDCVSALRQLTRSSTAVRSDRDQRRRAPATDSFARHVGTVSEWEIFWGSLAPGKVPAKKIEEKPAITKGFADP